MPALLLVAMVLAGSPAGAASSELEVLSGRFPLTLQFRGNPVAKDVMDVGEISRVLNVYSGRTDKFIDEEMRRDPRHAERFQRWKEANPGKLLLLHLNGEARAVWPAEVHERYFPGHWVYYPGAGLEAPIDATTTQIRVADARPFAARKFGNRDEDGASHRTDILLVEVDDAGRRQWHRSEYASITAVDAQSGILTLQRGRHGSTARTFAAGRTYVAPLVSGYWGGNVMWFYNLSSSCPTDRNGHTAADHFLDEIAHWFSTDGPLSNFDGIGFDVNYFKTKWPGFDVSNNGVADEGLAPDGRNLWREGVWAFLQRLRLRMGDDFILTADGWKEEMQMATGVLSGIESEGLVAPSDGWRLFGRLLNVQTYWQEHNDVTRPFSYITAKLRHPDDLKNAVSLRRLGAATACWLGVAYTDDGEIAAQRSDRVGLVPELTLGGQNADRWLGRPREKAILTAAWATDLWAGGGVRLDDSFRRGVTVYGGKIVPGPGDELRVIGTGESPHASITLRLPAIQGASGDVLLMFEAQALEALSGFTSKDRVPRQINIYAEGLPQYDSRPGENARFNNTMALMGTSRFTRQFAYFRRAADGSRQLEVTLKIEGNGAFALRNLSARDAPLILLREFEHGIVAANASQQPVTLDLAELLPADSIASLRRIELLPALFVDPQHPQARAMLQGNDGSRIAGSTVTVPALDGLFLRKVR